MIQDVMLKHEDQIKKDAYVAESKLHRIRRQARPVRLQTRINDQLQYRHDAATKIQKNLHDAPPGSRLGHIVHPRLRNVLYDGHDELHVACGVNLPITTTDVSVGPCT